VDVVILALLHISLNVGDDSKFLIVFCTLNAIIAYLLMNVSVFQPFFPVVDHTQHLVTISDESLMLIDVDVIFRDEAVVLEAYIGHILQMVLLLKVFQTLFDFGNATSFLDFAYHMSYNFEEGVVLGIVAIEGSCLFAIDKEHEVKGRDQSHSQ
jgi:hypothetical protein